MPSAWRVPPFGHVRIISRLQISVCTFLAFLADFALVEIVVRITLFYFYSFFKYYNNYNTDCSFLYLSIFFPILSMNLFRAMTPDMTFNTRQDAFQQQTSRTSSKKEVFQPHLPVRLPCYDLAPVIRFALDRSFRSRASGTPNSHGLTYKARERIHRAMADARLLANPTSWSRVADSNPN